MVVKNKLVLVYFINEKCIFFLKESKKVSKLIVRVVLVCLLLQNTLTV